MTLETPVWLQQGSFSSYADRTALDAMFEPGVLDAQTAPVQVAPASTDLAVTPNATTLSVDVAPGVAVIAGTDQTRQGKYVVRNTATVNVPITARPAAGQSRIDVVYAKVRDTSTGVGANDDWILGVQTGVPSGSPVVPALPSSSLALAQVTVAGGAGPPNLSAGNIVDARMRLRTRGHGQGFAPVQLTASAPSAANIVGSTGMISLYVGPYPCAWTAHIVVHALWQNIDPGGIFETSLTRADPGPVYTALKAARVSIGTNQGGAQQTVELSHWYTQANGAQVVFLEFANRISGSGQGTLGTDPNYHRVDATVFLFP
jgi:hypothetical protein